MVEQAVHAEPGGVGDAEPAEGLDDPALVDLGLRTTGPDVLAEPDQAGVGRTRALEGVEPQLEHAARVERHLVGLDDRVTGVVAEQRLDVLEQRAGRGDDDGLSPLPGGRDERCDLPHEVTGVSVEQQVVAGGA